MSRIFSGMHEGVGLAFVVHHGKTFPVEVVLVFAFHAAGTILPDFNLMADAYDDLMQPEYKSG